MSERDKTYEKLSPGRQALIDELLKMLSFGPINWQQGWRMRGAPISGATGKRYTGVNALYLTLYSMSKGYTDNRWYTYNQMVNNGWKFKKDKDGESLAKGQGALVEFYSIKEKNGGKILDEDELRSLSDSERRTYYSENTTCVRKHFVVFNGDLIDGVPKQYETAVDEKEKNSKAEQLIDFWSRREAKIFYGGDESYYNPKLDEIHIPNATNFYNMGEYYSTMFHEMGHSTAKDTRLNRKLEGRFGTPAYAIEELRAEITSIFLVQELDIPYSSAVFRNNVAYIQSWKEVLADSPHALFSAISDAKKISQYILDKEFVFNRIPYSIESKSKYTSINYKINFIGEYGQVQTRVDKIMTPEELITEITNIQALPENIGKEMVKVPQKDLAIWAIKKAEMLARETAPKLKEKPSELAAKEVPEYRYVDMKGRGMEELYMMSDREVVEKALNSYGNVEFQKLYEGKSQYMDEDRDEKALMYRIAMHATEGPSQVLRIFKTSGQYRPDKDSRYITLALDSCQEIARVRELRRKGDEIRMGKDKKEKKEVFQVFKDKDEHYEDSNKLEY